MDQIYSYFLHLYFLVTLANPAWLYVSFIILEVWIRIGTEDDLGSIVSTNRWWLKSCDYVFQSQQTIQRDIFDRSRYYPADSCFPRTKQLLGEFLETSWVQTKKRAKVRRGQLNSQCSLWRRYRKTVLEYWSVAMLQFWRWETRQNLI